MDINSINWNQIWKELRDKRKRPKHGPEYWNKRAPSFNDHVKKTGYSAAFLEIMKPSKTWTVMDMACGGGTLAIPLASKVKEVTAVDFSDGMLNIIKSRAKKAKINNIQTINAAWEDNWEEKGMGAFDVVVASRALAMRDVQAAIEKLNCHAKKRVFISTVSGEGPHDSRIFEAVGRKFTPMTDYIYLYNLLYQMGIRAEVAFIREDSKRIYNDHDTALKSFGWMLGTMNRQEQNRLKKFLQDHLIPHKGKWKLDYNKKIEWAVLSWGK